MQPGNASESPRGISTGLSNGSGFASSANKFAAPTKASFCPGPRFPHL